MKIKNPAFSAILLGLGLLAFSAGASARDHSDRHDNHGGYERDHSRYYGRHYAPDVRVVERRYLVREAPRRYYEPIYVRPAPVYRTEPGVVVRIGLPLPPPLFFSFN